MGTMLNRVLFTLRCYPAIYVTENFTLNDIYFLQAFKKIFDNVEIITIEKSTPITDDHYDRQR